MKRIVQQTEVCLVWGPREDYTSNGFLLVTLRLGKRRTAEDKAAVKAFLEACKRIQELPNPRTE